MADLTTPDNFMAFLSGFWNRFFQDRGTVFGMAHNDAYEIQQIYVNFIEAMGNLSIGTILPFHKELLVPIVLRKSTFSTGPDILKYNSGAYYGPQPPDAVQREGVTFVYGGLEQRSGLYYVGIPKTLSNMGPVIVNRLVEPSLLLARDSDFIIGNDIITFKADPFENPLIPKRIVADSNGNPEEELVLWAVDVEFETFRIHTQFGHMFSSKYISSDSYRSAVEALMAAYSNGPTPQLLDALICVLCGQPVTREVTETVESIVDSTGKTLIITDSAVYKVPAGTELRPNIVPGAVLAAGSGLTTVAQMFDYTRNPDWWQSVPALAMTRDFLWMDIESLGFINQTVKVEQETPVIVGLDILHPVRFALTGSPRDIETFWRQARDRGVAAGECLGEVLWKDAGLLDMSGNPDFTKDLYLNPMEFLVKRLIGTHLIVAKIKLDEVNSNVSFLPEIKHLQKTIPVWCSLMIIIEASAEDEYAFMKETGGVEVLTQEVSEVQVTDLIAGNIDNFLGDTFDIWHDTDSNDELLTKTPEALSDSETVSTFTSTIYLADAAANMHLDSYGAVTLAVSEEVTWNHNETCKP